MEKECANACIKKHLIIFKDVVKTQWVTNKNKARTLRLINLINANNFIWLRYAYLTFFNSYFATQLSPLILLLLSVIVGPEPLISFFSKCRLNISFFRFWMLSSLRCCICAYRFWICYSLFSFAYSCSYFLSYSTYSASYCLFSSGAHAIYRVWVKDSIGDRIGTETL